MKALLAFVITASISAQQPRPPVAPPGSGRIAGVLTDAATGQPIRKAQVKLVSASPRITRTTASDAEGRYRFETLPAGEYTLSAFKASYLESVFGARRPGPAGPGTPILLGANQKLDNLSLRLSRGGVIAGVVFDEFGDPSFNTMVRALRYVARGLSRQCDSA